MEGIRSYVWITLGTILALAAHLFNYYNTKPFYRIFFYIGVLFFFIGLAKLIYEKPKKAPHPRKKQSPSIITCSCGTKNHSISNYCHICGKKLIHRIG